MKLPSFLLLPRLILAVAPVFAPSLQGRDSTIFQDLPPHMRVLVDWGQRPEWSIDGKWIYFLPRAYADIFRIEVASGKIEPVTNHYFHEGYKRVLCLWNGDLLLAGPDQFDAADPWASRHKLRLSILQAPFDQPPVLLDAYCDEGPAVSKTDNRIAWTLPGQREIMMGEIGFQDGRPALLNRRMVLSFNAQDRPLTERLETQDFVPGRNELVFTYYHGTIEEPFYFANAYVLDLDSGRLVNLTQNENRYDEAEGIAPDGSFLLIESDRHAEPKQWKVDVYLLKLDGSNQPERLADWTKYPGFRSDNPVVSPDGKTIAIQRGFRAGAGQGSGIVLFDLESYRRSKSE